MYKNNAAQRTGEGNCKKYMEMLSTSTATSAAVAERDGNKNNIYINKIQFRMDLIELYDEFLK